MKRYLVSNTFYSNCVITALIIRLRIGGRLVFKITKRPFGVHVMVRKRGYYIDFSPACTAVLLPLHKQALFYGGLRVRRCHRFA